MAYASDGIIVYVYLKGNCSMQLSNDGDRWLRLDFCEDHASYGEYYFIVSDARDQARPGDQRETAQPEPVQRDTAAHLKVRASSSACSVSCTKSSISHIGCIQVHELFTPELSCEPNLQQHE